jgi:hypothetical protein
MEWTAVFRRNECERKTALVQLSDERTILLIQISAMKSEFKISCYPLDYVLSSPRIPPKTEGMCSVFIFAVQSALTFFRL